MMLPDLLFLALVICLPIAVSIRLFRIEPAQRPFLGTYFLAVFGTSILYGLAALVLSLTNIGGLGMFDGLLATAASIPIAFVVGLVTRHRRSNSTTCESHAKN